MEIDKEVFLFDVEARLKQWNATVAGLEQRLQQDEEGSSALSQRIESLIQKRNTFDNKVEKLRQCSARGWREVAREVAQAVEEVEEAWTCVASALSRRDSDGQELTASTFV